jgi:hypothetical protein
VSSPPGRLLSDRRGRENGGVWMAVTVLWLKVAAVGNERGGCGRACRSQV